MLGLFQRVMRKFNFTIINKIINSYYVNFEMKLVKQDIYMYYKVQLIKKKACRWDES